MLEPIKFGTDGWRAVIAEQFTFANVERVAYAIGLFIKATYAHGKSANIPVLVGFDTRFMADKFADRAARVLVAMGLNVKVAQRDLPTPCIAWATQAETTGGALQFTASHNPPEYCGVKYIPPYAGPATSDITEKIVANLQLCPAHIALSTDAPMTFDVSAPYMEALGGLVDLALIGRSGLNVACDALYGTSRGYLDQMLVGAGLKVTTLHHFRDTLFGGGMPEPKPENLSELMRLVKKGKFDIGTACDGDSDRFAVVDEHGTFYTTNQLICLITRHLFKNRGMTGSIVRTVSTTHMLDHIGAKYGLPVLETPVGFKYVGQLMREQDVLIGGEESGGISIKGHIPEKDGILGNLLLIEMLAYEKKPLSKIWRELKAEIGVSLEERGSVLHLNRMSEQLNMEHVWTALDKSGLTKVDKSDGLKLYFDDGAWLLIRKSGTEPALRLYGESQSSESIDSHMRCAMNTLKTLITV